MSKSEKRLGIIFSISILAAFLIMNIITFYCTDDYCYMFSFATKEKIASVPAIIRSLMTHYMKMHGRVLVQFFTHSFCWMGKNAYNIVNTIGFAGLIAVSCRHIFGKVIPYYFFIIGALLWLLTPSFGECFLWITGSPNYLYTILIALIFLLPFCRFNKNTTPKHPALLALFMFPMGVIAGWTSENISAGVCFFLITLIIYDLIKDRKIPAFHITGLLGVIAGFLIMVLAPGQSIRLENNGGIESFTDIIGKILPITLNVLKYFWPIVILDILMIIVFFRKHGLKKWEKLMPSILFFIATLASVYSMIISPKFPDRVWSGPLCFMIIFTGLLYRAIDWDKKTAPKLRIFIILSLFIGVSAVTAVNLPKVYRTSKALRERDSYAFSCVENGDREIYIENVPGSGSRFDSQPHWGDLASYPEYWVNVAMARYYGVDKVYLKE